MSRAYLAGNIAGGFVGSATTAALTYVAFRIWYRREFGSGWKARDWWLPS